LINRFTDYVNKNPSAFADAYFDFAAIRIYQWWFFACPRRVYTCFCKATLYMCYLLLALEWWYSAWTAASFESFLTNTLKMTVSWHNLWSTDHVDGMIPKVISGALSGNTIVPRQRLPRCTNATRLRSDMFERLVAQANNPWTAAHLTPRSRWSNNVHKITIDNWNDQPFV